MRTAAKGVMAASLVVSIAGLGLAYTRPRWQIGPEIKQSHWPVSSPVPVVVNIDQPNVVVPGSQPFLAVRNMFERRANYTPLEFTLTQASSPESVGFDGVNLVTFKNTPSNQSAVFGFAAVAWFWWTLVDDAPVVIESDIVFSNEIAQTTTGSGGVDIENLGGHELIHFLSFEHSAVIASTAFPSYFTQVPNERNLALDDLAAVGFLYPFADTPATTGSLSGTVQKPGGAPVFGAHVVAQRLPEGTPVSDISVTGGQWRIDALPPGQYQVYVEPLDGPSFPSNTLFSGVYVSETADQAIQTTFAGGNSTPTTFQVVAGAETTVGAIEVPASGGSLNLLHLGLRSSRSPVFGATAININQGGGGYLTLHGPGVSLVPNNGVSITGSGVSVSSSGVARGVSQGDPYMNVLVQFQPDAKPGVRTIFVNDGVSIAALTGGIELHPANPYPNLLRNDELTNPGPLSALSLPLDPNGPDSFPGTGEGALRRYNGSSDDDDLYAPSIESGFMDPDVAVLTDSSRPLVLYQLDDPSRTLFLGKSPFGRLVVTYTDAP